MDPDRNETTRRALLDRFRKSWIPPTAALGALAAFVAAVFRVRPTPSGVSPGSGPALAPEPPGAQRQTSAPPSKLGREYSKSDFWGSASSAAPFRHSLAGIAVGPKDRIYALGDGEVRIFQPNGDLIKSWKVTEAAACLGIGSDGRVYIGAPGRVELYDAQGTHTGGFAAGEADRPALVSAIKVFRDEILVADAAARRIRRYDAQGKQLCEIGTQNKTNGFILPNRSLDFFVSEDGVVHATDSGRHQVTAWKLDGAPLGRFGKFGQRNPEDFVGCCNPVNVAATPDGKIVTAEKAIARVKVYEPDGKLLAVMGPEHFDPNCIHLHLAVDSRGRILVADPVRREIKVFSLVVRIGVNEPFCLETASSCVGADIARRYDSLAGHARETAGVELRFVYYKLEDQLVSAVQQGHVDGVISKVWPMLRAFKAAGLSSERICDLPFPDGDPHLTGVFVAHTNGPVKSMADLAGKRLAIGRPESYENSHAVDRILRKLGVSPRTKREYAGCIPAALSVLEGEADAAVVSSYCTRYGLDEIIGQPGVFRALGETDPIPFVTFALSENLPVHVRSKLKESLLQASGPKAREDLFPGGIHPPTPWNPEEIKRV